MRKYRVGTWIVVLALAAASTAWGQTRKPEPFVRKGDRLVIVGDSITYGRMYSLMIDEYFTMCHPDLEVLCIQNAVSGENTAHVLSRMQKTSLDLWKPTAVTICEGMNNKDREERRKAFAREIRQIVQNYKAAGVRVMLGSPGIVTGTHLKIDPEFNNILKGFRDTCEKVALEDNVRFVDIYNTMVKAQDAMKKVRGEDYAFCPRDGLHPGWPGQMAMAYAFLKQMNPDPDIAKIEWDASTGNATVNDGHTLLGATRNTVELESRRYPFVTLWGGGQWPEDTRSVALLLGFFDELARFTLTVKGLEASNYRVQWEWWNASTNVWQGYPAHDVTANQLGKGINLPKEFWLNPFTACEQRIRSAINIKYTVEYYIQQGTIEKQAEFVRKHVLKGAEGGPTAEELVKDPMRLHDMLQKNVIAQRVPVRHRIVIEKK